MNNSRRYVVQVGYSITKSNSAEVAIQSLTGHLTVSTHELAFTKLKLTGNLIETGVAILNVRGTQGYIFDTLFARRLV